MIERARNQHLFYFILLVGCANLLISDHLKAIYQSTKQEIKPNSSNSSFDIHIYSEPWEAKVSAVPLVAAVCGLEPDKDQRFHRLLNVWFKSLAIFNYNETREIILIMDQNHYVIEGMVKEIPETYRKNLKIRIVPSRLPPEEYYHNKVCSPQRLFLIEMFPQLDAVIYVDVDVVFLRHLDALVEEFTKFKQNQYWAFSGRSYYCPRFVKKPCYNAGVMLMNLTRLRNYPTNITRQFMNIKVSYLSEALFTDQFVINTFLSENPKMQESISTEWDYNHVTCKLQNRKNFESSFRGIALMHGSGGHFTGTMAWDFRTVFDFFEKLNISESLFNLANKLERALNDSFRLKIKTKCHPHYFIPWTMYYTQQFVDFVKKESLAERNSFNDSKS